jgi:hypothetical protein
MAQQITRLLVCDKCGKPDTTEPVHTYKIAVDKDKPFTVDLCDTDGQPIRQLQTAAPRKRAGRPRRDPFVVDQ